jgi:hypothetical protein
MPWLARQQLAAHLERILAAERGELVQRAVHGESGVGVTHRPPPQHGNVSLRVVRFHEQVGNFVHHVRCPLGARGVEGLALGDEAIRPATAQHTLAHDGLVPGHGLALCIDRATHA